MGSSGGSSSTWSAQLAAEAAAFRFSSQHARSSCCASAAALAAALTGAGALTRGCSFGSVAPLRPALSPPPAAFLGLEGSAARGPGGLRGGAATRWASTLPPPLGVAALFNASAGWLVAACCDWGFCAPGLERAFLARHFARLTSTCASCRHGAAGRVRRGRVDRLGRSTHRSLEGLLLLRHPRKLPPSPVPPAAEFGATRGLAPPPRPRTCRSKPPERCPHSRALGAPAAPAALDSCFSCGSWRHHALCVSVSGEV